MNYHLLLLFATNDNPKVFLNKILNFLLTKKLGLEFTYSGTSRGSFKLLLLSDVIKSKERINLPLVFIRLTPLIPNLKTPFRNCKKEVQ